MIDFTIQEMKARLESQLETLL